VFPDLGSTQQEVALLVGFFLPLLLAIPIQSHWPTELKALFSVAAYAAAGAVTAAATGELTGKTFWQTTLEILVLGVVGYQGVWKPINLAPKIEALTNVNKAPAQPALDGGALPQSASGTPPSAAIDTPPPAAIDTPPPGATGTPPPAATPLPSAAGEQPVGGFTLTPSVEALLEAGTRLVDELTQGLYVNRTSNGVPANDAPPEQLSPEHQDNPVPAEAAENAPDKAAAAWVRAG
jgi:hypothetical protein